MGKNILVPESMLCNVYRLLIYLEDKSISPDVRRLCVSIEVDIKEKIRKMEARRAFTAYKMAPPGQERESLRKEYIRVAEIRKSFTSDNEIPYTDL
jgi:hypothetical protein